MFYLAKNIIDGVCSFHFLHNHVGRHIMAIFQHDKVTIYPSLEK